MFQSLLNDEGTHTHKPINKHKHVGPKQAQISRADVNLLFATLSVFEALLMPDEGLHPPPAGS